MNIAIEAKEMQKIKPATVVRDKNGFWLHPDLPSWGENVPRDDFRGWCLNNEVRITTVMMQEDNAEFSELWSEKGLSDCTPWCPTLPTENAFLLSLHDTDDGPVAMYAIPTI